MEKVTILGSANAVAKMDQQNTHLLIETDHRKIMVDCGDHPAASLGRAGVTINQINSLVLTHFHADHVGSLPLLLMDMWLEKRIEPLSIYGLETTLDKAKTLLDVFGWETWPNMFPVNFFTIPEEGKYRVIDETDLKMTAMPVLHLIPTIGLRFEFPDGKVVTYSCDSEPCENLKKLANQADVLLQEAAGPGKGHSSPEQAGEIAKQCMVKRLILIHYEARRGKETLLKEASDKFAGQIEIAEDGMVI